MKLWFEMMDTQTWGRMRESNIFRFVNKYMQRNKMCAFVRAHLHKYTQRNFHLQLINLMDFMVERE